MATTMENITSASKFLFKEMKKGLKARLSGVTAEEFSKMNDDFGDIMALNDKAVQTIFDFMSEEEIKKYELNPPRVIAIGNTSSGKSSLLQNIVGFPIFPVLDRVCTRRPFNLSMKKARGGSHSLNTKDTSRNEGKQDELRTAELQFPASGKNFMLPAETDAVRREIADLQQSNSDVVDFSKQEIRATVISETNETFSFTDLPGVFLVSDMKMGSNFKESQLRNNKLKQTTMEISRHYVEKPNTIVLVVISASDWLHGMHMDPLCGHLCEWLEECRKTQNVDVYGVVTKLDMHETLSDNSPVKKVLTGQLPEGHMLRGLKAKKWIPVVSSPQILNETHKEQAGKLEIEAIRRCLKGPIPNSTLEKMPMGRAALIRELKFALLKSIIQNQKDLRSQISIYSSDVQAQLKLIPKAANPSEKKADFDRRLTKLKVGLQREIGQKGPTATGNLRMRLLVRAPAKFEKDLAACSLRGDVISEVEQILNQLLLESGGSFDSDMAFKTFAPRIIEKYRKPCLEMVKTCANIVLEALRKATENAFGEYKQLKNLVVRKLGLQQNLDLEIKSNLDDLLGKANSTASSMFSKLLCSTVSKVLTQLDAQGTMQCFHPLWIHFDTFHRKILSIQESKSKTAQTGPEDTLQEILELPTLAKRAKAEGLNAITTYEGEKKVSISPQRRAKIMKHFTRIEVMGYIIRMTLVGTVFPIIIRDLRDGLFKGIYCGLEKFGDDVETLLRKSLIYDPEMAKTVLSFMDPSPEDMKKRAKWEKKAKVMQDLQFEFDKCQERIQTLKDKFEDH
mmetsp:Transcript_17368/g.27749  ORF Transcript_17368/g.27749 Transcript_17368/m.27749 type:complete len:792 (+) Transcript_17368:211-2586(+)|eukprot:jgi/Bigna1/85696/estExt_fgenesh1_pg.C_50246